VSKANADSLAQYTRRCALDRAFFFLHELKIEAKDGQIVPLKFYPYQLRLIQLIEHAERQDTPCRIVWLKSRQAGGSTTIAAEQYYRLRHRDGTRALTLAHRDSTTQHILNIVKLFHRKANPVACPKATRTTKRLLEYESLRSSLEIHTAGSRDASRGGTYRSVHLSEVAYYPDAEAVMAATLNTVPDLPGTMVVLESSANGLGNPFHARWDDAQAGKGDFVPLFTPWFECHDYCRGETPQEQAWHHEWIADQSDAGLALYARRLNLSGSELRTVERHHLTPGQIMWRRSVVATAFRGDEARFRQEYPATPEEAFIGSGRPFFDLGLVFRQTAVLRENEPAFTPGILRTREADTDVTSMPFGHAHVRLEESPADGEGWRIYEAPQVDHDYVIGVDASEGLQIDQAVSGSSDFSAAVIIDRSSRHTVATFHGRVVPETLAEQIALAGKAYYFPMMVVEFNGSGETVIYILINEFNYPILYHRLNLLTPGKSEPRPGWKTSRSTRRPLLDRFARAHRTGGVVILDARILNEMRTFTERSDGRLKAQDGKFDDFVMSTALALEGDRAMGTEQRRSDNDDDTLMMDPILTLPLSSGGVHSVLGVDW